MTGFTQSLKDAVTEAKIFMLATADKNGNPNSVPMGMAKILSDDEFMLYDFYMNKTKNNIKANPRVAVSFLSTKRRAGYQLKGNASIEPSGKNFDEAKRWLTDTRHSKADILKAVVVIKVDEIYSIIGGTDTSVNLAVHPEAD